MSAGAPSPDSRHACSPSTSDRRRSSCQARAASRAARSWAASRSACREVRVTTGAGSAAHAGGRLAGVDLGEQVMRAVEESAVHTGAGNGRHADLLAAGSGPAERGDDALAAACRVGLPPGQH